MEMATHQHCNIFSFSEDAAYYNVHHKIRKVLLQA